MRHIKFKGEPDTERRFVRRYIGRRWNRSSGLWSIVRSGRNEARSENQFCWLPLASSSFSISCSIDCFLFGAASVCLCWIFQSFDKINVAGNA